MKRAEALGPGFAQVARAGTTAAQRVGHDRDGRKQGTGHQHDIALAGDAVDGEPDAEGEQQKAHSTDSNASARVGI